MGREKRGMGLWGVRDPGVFFMWFQQVLNSVLLDCRTQGLPKWFQQVLFRPVWIPTLSVPIKND